RLAETGDAKTVALACCCVSTAGGTHAQAGWRSEASAHASRNQTRPSAAAAQIETGSKIPEPERGGGAAGLAKARRECGNACAPCHPAGSVGIKIRMSESK